MADSSLQTPCPHCLKPLPETDNINPIQYCPFCGEKLPPHMAKPIIEVEVAPSPTNSIAIFMGTLLLTLALTWLLNTVFHLPIFIAGAFLPLFFWPRKK
jgi:hypothetical protein